MRPYVDFADSKGMLLWVIYGIGYLLSPHTYYGVWVLSCLCYGGILYYNYKTAQLFLGDTRRSLAVAMVMPFFYFQYWFHDDVRAEDFCTLFVSVSLYLMLRVLCSNGYVENVRRTGLVLGGCFMALMMIKFNIAAMQATMILVIIYSCMRSDRSRIVPLMSWMALAMAAVALPFVIYLLLRGSFTAFIVEYFVKTMKTVNSEEGSLDTSYLGEVSIILGSAKHLAMLLALVISGWLASRRLFTLKYTPLLIALFFYAICIHHTLFHYHKICCIFLNFLPIHCLSYANVRLRTRHIMILAAVIIGWGVFENSREDSHLHNVSYWQGNTRESDYALFSGLIQGHRPTILYLYGCDYGYGLACDALPAGKYWSYQLGTTPEMEQEHLRPLLEGTADYIVVNDYKRAQDKGFSHWRICSLGYRQLCNTKYFDFSNRHLENRIYQREDLE